MMKIIRYGLFLACMLVISAYSAEAQVSIGISTPHISIGINLPVYPEFVRVPSYPVYYAPQVAANYFFYDGMYWVYEDDNWYASTWYNGPWWIVQPEVVPVYILRVPVRYYRQPPPYFRGWRSNAPPRWGQHWGHGWEQHRRGWDKWNRSSAPKPAPLPVYQREFREDRYPKVENQPTLHSQNYNYQPRQKIVRQHYKQSGITPAQRGKQGGPNDRRSQPYRRYDEKYQKPATVQPSSQQQSPAIREQRQQPGAAPVPRGKQSDSIDRPPQYPYSQQPPVVREQHQQQGPVYQKKQEPRSQGKEYNSEDKGSSQKYDRGYEKGQKDEGKGRGHDN